MSDETHRTAPVQTQISKTQYENAKKHFFTLGFTPREISTVASLPAAVLLESIADDVTTVQLWDEKKTRLSRMPHTGMRYARREFLKHAALAQFIRIAKRQLSEDEKGLPLALLVGNIPQSMHVERVTETVRPPAPSVLPSSKTALPAEILPSSKPGPSKGRPQEAPQKRRSFLGNLLNGTPHSPAESSSTIQKAPKHSALNSTPIMPPTHPRVSSHLKKGTPIASRPVPKYKPVVSPLSRKKETTSVTQQTITSGTDEYPIHSPTSVGYSDQPIKKKTSLSIPPTQKMDSLPSSRSAVSATAGQPVAAPLPKRPSTSMPPVEPVEKVFVPATTPNQFTRMSTTVIPPKPPRPGPATTTPRPPSLSKDATSLPPDHVRAEPTYAPNTPYFVRGNTEYRRVGDGENAYEYNRLKEGAGSGGPGGNFSKGGIPDGYVLLNADGSVRGVPVSYVVLDEHVKQDMSFIDAIYDVPLARREYAYYRDVEKALRSLNRVVVRQDNNSVTVISAGKRWCITLDGTYQITDRADGELFSFVDVAGGDQMYQHVELKVDWESKQVYLYDRENGAGKVATIPYVTLDDTQEGYHEKKDATDAALVKLQTSAPIEQTGGGPQTPERSMPRMNRGMITPQGSANAEDTGTSAVNEPLVVLTPPARNGQADVPKTSPALPPIEEAKEEHIYTPLGTLRHVSDGGSEKIFEMPHGGTRVTFIHDPDGSIRDVAVHSLELMYPATELASDWERALTKKHSAVGQFTTDDKEQDITTAKREVIRRGRDLIIYKKILKALPKESREYAALKTKAETLIRDTHEQYGRVFKY